MTEEAAARAALVETARQLDLAGLNHNSSGNLGVRVGAHVLVTPSGIPAAAMTDHDPVLLDADGTPLGDQRRVPTSEWRLHVELLRRRPDLHAVVHTHSPEATAAATLGRPVPAVHYVVARFGATELPCAAYATYGSIELARHVTDTLGPRGTACLMANHGAVAAAADLGAAAALALDIEWFCGVHRRARQLGEPLVLADDEIERVSELFAGYGQPAEPSRRPSSPST